MPVVRLRPTKWEPDGGTIRVPTICDIYGAIPYAGWYIPSPQYLKSVKLYPAGYDLTKIGGFYIHSDAATRGAAYMYLGTDDDLYRTSVANNGDLTDATGAATFSAFSSESGWQFASFGNNVLATNGVDPIQIATTPTTNFVASNQVTTPTSYDPYCKYITTIKNNVLIGNISFSVAPSSVIAASALSGTSYPTMVMWSANDNARRFGDPKATPDRALLGSDWQDFPDEHGPITGLVGGESALIFKQSAIYRMDGPPWTFQKIVTNAGTIYPNSIVQHHQDVYFWGPAGPTVLRSGSAVPEPLASGRVQREIQDGAYSTAWSPLANINLCGAVDPSNDIIVWSSSETTYGGIFLVYSIIDDAFSKFRFFDGTDDVSRQRMVLFMRGAPDGVSFNIGGSITTTDSFQLSNVYGIYDVDASTETGLFRFVKSTTPVTSDDYNIWDTPYFKFPFLTFPVSDGNEQESFPSSSIVRVRPIYDAVSPLDVYVVVNTQSRFPGSYSQKTGTYLTSADYQEENGWIQIDSEFGTHHQISVSFVEPSGTKSTRVLPGVKSFFELEVEYMSGGKYGSGYRT